MKCLNCLSPWSRLAAIGSIAFGLSACGDDITEQVNANVGAVETSKDLPECTKDIVGQTAFVSETHEFLGCDGKEWQTLSANTVSVGDNVCTSTSLSDGTGFEIFCNGESIGTVKNGEKGEPGEKGADGQKGDKGDKGEDGAPGAKGDDGAKGDPGDPGKDGTNGTNGTGCTIKESTALTATIACGSETFTMDLTGSVDQPEVCDANVSAEDCTTLDSAISLSGVSQKGPFVTGTDITAYELQNGRSLKQTGKTFGGKIERADGTFDIKTVKLNSAFAYIVADGFYRNEVTGENSSAAIKLRALTNLKGRSSANINLVTHLEYDRVQYLVTRKDSSVTKAKMAAEEELFAAFGINNSGFEGLAEDLNVLKEGKGNAALLAISVLLQGDRNESELTALLASLSVDLGDNGQWDNAKQRAQIADWAMKTDLNGGLPKIRANVEGWKLAESAAPAFEQHVTNFWMNELGVDKCDSSNVGALFAVKNKNSAYYAANDSAYTDGDNSLVRLICDASGEWRFATEFEKDTAAFSAEWPKDTAVVGKINTNNVYVKDGKWRRGTELDASLDAACVESNRGMTDSLIVEREPVWYICDKNDGVSDSFAWRKATTAEADTALFGTPGEGDEIVKIGNVYTSITYVYENKKWRQGTALDRVEDLGACTLEKVSKVVHLSTAEPNDGWYKCDSYKTVVGNEVQTSSAWREATNQEADTAGLVAKAKEIREDCAGMILKGNLTKDSLNYYIRESDKWRKADICEVDSYDHTNHIAWEPAAVDAAIKQGTVTNQYYVYDSLEGNWRQSTSSLDLDSDLGGCTSKRSQTYNTLVDRFTTGNSSLDEQLTGNVPGEVVRKIDGTDTLFYVCLDDLWREASVARVETRIYSCGLSSRSAYQGLYIDDVYSVEDMMLGAPYTDNYYVCDKDTFRVLTESEKWALDVSTGRSYIRCDLADNGKLLRLRYTNTKFVCKNGFYEWDDVPVFVDSLEEAVPFDGNSYEYAVDSAGNKYETVAIGTQLWMATNLRIDIEDAVVPHRPYKDTLPSGEITTSYAAIDMDSIGYYGRLYRYEDAVNACAKVKTDYNSIAFHVPTLEEWELLLSYGADDDFPAKAYKSKDTWGRFGGGDNRYQFGIIAVGEAYESNFCYFEGRHICFESDKFTSFWASNFPDNQIGSISVEAKGWYERENNGFKYEKSRCPLYLPVRCVADLDIPLPPKKP